MARIRDVRGRSSGSPVVSLGYPIALVVVTLATVFVVTSCTLSHRQQGAHFADEGRWDEAVAAYRQALHEDPFDDDLQAALARAKVQAAAAHYRDGRAALEGARLEEALHTLELAVALAPSRREYQFALTEALRLRQAREQVRAGEQLTSLGRWDDALVAYERAVALDPSLTVALDGITRVTAHQRASRTFADATLPITLRFQKAKLREVFEILARTAGVNVILDKDVRDEAVTMFVKDMPYDDALKLILNTHDLLAHRVTQDTLLITPNTKQKQAQYQDLMVRTFYLSNAEAKTAVNLLRSMLESKRVFADDAVNAVVVRDEPAKLHLAERVIDAIDRRQPEVMLEVEVLEVNRTKLLEYGLNYPKQASAGVVPPGFVGAVPTTAQTFTFDQLTGLGKDNYLFTIPSTATLNFFKQESQAKTLAAPTLRVLNKQKATINVGDKQPILLSTTNVLPGQAATGAVPTTSTVTSVEFKDTGVKLTVEPTVHLADELTLKLKIEVTRVGQEVVLQESPEIKQFRFGNRMAETTLRVRDGQTVVIGGLLADERREIRVTVPWLGDLPLLGPLLSSKTTDTISTEVVLTITPRIIRRLETPGLEAQAFWSGTEGQFATSPLFAPGPQPMSYPMEDGASAASQTPEETGREEGGKTGVVP